METTEEPTVEAPPAVEPFWHRMGALFGLPLLRPALARIAGATLAVAALAWAAHPMRYGGALRDLAWCAAMLYIARYGFLVIERSASGYLDPRFYPETAGGGADWSRPAKMFFMLVLLPVVIVVSGSRILPFGMVLLLFCGFLVLLPASVMVLARTDSLNEAVNPRRGMEIAHSIGKPYLLLLLFLGMLLLGLAETLSLLLPDSAAAQPGTRPGLGTFLGMAMATTALSAYVLLIACALIGYTMFQYSAALGIDIVGPGTVGGQKARTASAELRRQRDALIGTLVAAGDFREAIELISDSLREQPSDLSLHGRLHTLLLQEGSEVRIRTHADRYLELLVAAGNGPECMAFFTRTRSRFAQFVPQDALARVRLAGFALDAHDPALAAELIRAFDRTFPNHPAIPEAYLVGARALLQSGRGPDAQRLLEYVRTRYPDTPASVEAQRYLARFAGAAAPRA